jgi:hypothetical protein
MTDPTSKQRAEAEAFFGLPGSDWQQNMSRHVYRLAREFARRDAALRVEVLREAHRRLALAADASDSANEQLIRYRGWINEAIASTPAASPTRDVSAPTTGCPCTLIAPCSPNCTCASPVLSGGCRRCARYGSLDQRTEAALAIAAALAGWSPSVSAPGDEPGEATVERLRKALAGLRRYSDHMPTCGDSFEPEDIDGDACDCGYEVALSEAIAALSITPKEPTK